MSAPVVRADAARDEVRPIECARLWDRLLALALDAVYCPLLVGIAPSLAGRSSLRGLWGIVSHWAYFALAESEAGHAVTWWHQATWGKYLYGMRVVTITGEPLSTIRASMRYAVKFVSLLTCIGALISVALILFTGRKQALHDWISETMVVTAPIGDELLRHTEAKTNGHRDAS
jgi:uncharacterized RDD family membrane protein YckC